MGLLDIFKKNVGQNLPDEEKKSEENTSDSNCCCSEKNNMKDQKGEKNKHDCCA